LGEFKDGRFEPSASLTMALGAADFRRVFNLEAGDHSVIRYLKGETLSREDEKGYTVVCMDGYPLGWAKQENGILKNLYPKGWRMQ
jgi:NOL1/NOP2/fmu family ribosome biogenesis protein